MLRRLVYTFFKEANILNNYTAEIIKNSLFDSIDQLLEHRDIYLNNPQKDFVRTQKISFRDTMLFPMLTSAESVPAELLDFFPEITLPSQPAMNYRRNQIKVCAFQDLFKNFTSQLPQNKTFRGMRLIACDGTRLGTPFNPEDSDSYVECIEGRRGFNQYHLNTFYDALNDVFLDAVIQNYFSMDEKLAFCEMLDRFPKDQPSIITADRGYSSYNVLDHAIRSGHHFVFRLQASMGRNLFFNAVNELKKSTFDIEDDIHIGRIRTKETKKLRNYHFLSTTKHYDHISKGSKDIDCYHLRLVKFELSSGNNEYLVTNLPKSQFSFEDIKEIYRLRWTIETSYRFLKYPAGMIHSHSLKQSFIFQEVFAKLICYNFCSAVRRSISVTETTKKKHTYMIEISYLFKVCIRYLKNKVMDAESLIKKRMVPVRAGRKYERNLRRQHADTLQYR